MITQFEDFIFENNGKFKTIDYKIVVNDLKDTPRILITDFEIIKTESGKSEIKGKGFIKMKKGWIAFDDFQDKKTRTVWNKQFSNGIKKIKIYES